MLLWHPSDEKWGNQEGFSTVALASLSLSARYTGWAAKNIQVADRAEPVPEPFCHLFFGTSRSCLESRAATASALGTPQNLAVVVRLVGGWILVWTHVRWMGTLHLGILSSGTWCQTVSPLVSVTQMFERFFSPNWVPFFILESSREVFFSLPTYIWRGFWNQVALFIRPLLLLFSSL